MLTATDLFCGAGGSSSGAIAVPGVIVRMAANHWRLAVETHNTNHPETDHDCADISQTDPRRYPVTDILWASPECTNHSQARGKKRRDATPDVLFGEALPEEAADRSRATMWCVCRFVEAMILRGRPYKAFVVENVVEVHDWMFFEPWKAALRTAGYCLHFVYLNSMHAQAGGLPAPQSRDRFYCVGHLEKIRCPDLDKWTRPSAWCPKCDRVVTAMKAWKRPDRQYGRYRQQYVWRCPSSECRNHVVEPGWLPAAVAIDWTLRGQRIGDRAKPLAPKTLARIEAGLAKYARPITLEAAGNTFERRPGVRTWPVDAPLTTQTTTATKAVAVPPMLVPVEGREGKNAASSDQPMRTQSTRSETALVVPIRTHGTASSTDKPLKTCVAGNQGQALVAPTLVVRGESRESGAKPVTDPVGAITAWGSQFLLVPLRNNNTAKQVTDPLDTVAAAGNHHALLAWDHLLFDFNGPARTPGDPLPTQTVVEGNALLGVDINVEDCEFRMLEPSEIKLGMAFTPEYVLLGNRREQVRLVGNAVTPPAARDLISAIAEVLHGQDVA